MSSASDELDVWLHFGNPATQTFNNTSALGGATEARWNITDEIEHISFTYGRDGANPLTGDIVAGSCQITVRNDNDDWSPYNTSGAYYSSTPLPWVGRALCVNFSGDAHTAVRPQQAWFGFVVSVKPTVILSPTGGKVKRAIITARGPLMYLQRLAFMSEKFGAGTSRENTSECIRGAVGNASGQAGFGSIEYYLGYRQDSELNSTVPNPERFIGTRIPERFWVKPGETLLSAVRRVAAFEGGDIIEQRNLDGATSFTPGNTTFLMQAGNYRTSWQYAIAPEDNLLFTDEARADLDATDIPIQYIELINTTDDIYNHVECEVSNYEAGTTEVLWTLPEANTTDGTAPYLDVGESVTYEFTYPGEDAAAGVIGIDSFVTPLAEPTDLTANSLPDGTGSDRASAVVGQVTFEGVNRAVVTVTNTFGSDDLYITKLQVRGVTLIKNTSTIVNASDSTSVRAYGIRTYRRQNDLETNVEEAQAWVARTLARYKDPRPALKLVFSPNYSDNAALAGYRIQVGDRIEVKANATDGCGLGFQEYFYVERISHDITWPETGEKNWRCEFLCSWTPPLTALTGNQPASTGTLTPVGP